MVNFAEDAYIHVRATNMMIIIIYSTYIRTIHLIHAYIACSGWMDGWSWVKSRPLLSINEHIYKVGRGQYIQNHMGMIL